MKRRGKSMAKRAEITQRVVDKFRGREFDWDSGATCLHLAREQARQFGHRKLPIVPPLAGPLDALRAIRAQGVETLAELLDRHFQRLPAPAFAWVGDLVMGPAPENGLAAVGIVDGVGNVIGWHEGAGSELATIKFAGAFLTAGWRL